MTLHLLQYIVTSPRVRRTAPTPNSRFLWPNPGLTPITFPLFPNPHGIISFTDPHPLTSVVSSLQKHRGGAFLALQTFNAELSILRPPLFIPFIFFMLHAPIRHGRSLTLCLSIISALFSSRRGCTPGCTQGCTPSAYPRSRHSSLPTPLKFFSFKLLGTLLHIFATSKSSILLFSSVCALFAINTWRWVRGVRCH